jgi:UDP-glucose 4-epimerase
MAHEAKRALRSQWRPASETRSGNGKAPTKVLVTGGAGFVGSNLVRHLCQSWAADVAVLDDLFTGRLEQLAGHKFEFVHGSVTDRGLVNELASGKDVIFHLAARNIIASGADPHADLDVNAKGTLNVLQAAEELGIPRVVYTSTASVYGNAPSLPAHEDSRPFFLNFYSVSKYAGESYAQVFAHARDVPVGVIRYSNVYGPQQSVKNPYCGVIGKFIDCALRGEDIVVHGDGEQTRDFTYVDDACAATMLAATDDKAVGEVCNVATGVETTINSLAQTIIDLVGSGSQIRHVPSRDIDYILRRVLNVDRANVKLGYQPRTSLRDGLARTIEWCASEQAAHLAA